MALGDYNNNKDKQYNTPTLYSAYKTSNIEGVDPSAINYTFWNGLLKISISPMKEKKGDVVEFDHENNISIYLTHVKSKQLADEIDLFLKDPKKFSNVGVSSGGGLLSISNGIELTGKFNPCIIIRKITESGKEEAAFCYQFKFDYHYTVRNFDSKTNDFDKVYDNNVELEMLKTLLIQHYQAMSGAIAYSIMEYGKYDNTRLNNKLDSIAEKMGVSYKNDNSSSNYKKNTSMFNKKEGRSYTMDDLEDIGDGE